MKNFKGGVAVITGGGSGLGKALAAAAFKRGMKLVLADVQQDALDHTVNELRAQGSEVMGVATDVTDAASVQALAERVEAQFGRVNLLFNNAGVTSSGPVWESTEKDWDWVLGVNLKGVINGMRSFTPKMLASATADKTYEGCIVNTASMAGLITAPGMGIYSVSKHAVIALSECLHFDLELVSPRLRAAVLCPSYVTTAIGDSDRNRPSHLINSQAPTRAQLASLAAAQQAVKQGGLSPDEVAEHTFRALGNDSFYIFPSPEVLAVAQPRFGHIMNQTSPELPYDLFPALRDRRDRMLATQAQ